MITSRNGFSGSVTNACRMCVVIGSRTPARPATSVDQPAVAQTTARTRCGRAVVSTAVTRPSLALETRHLRVRVDLHSEPVGASRITPDDGVVPDDPARRVVERAEDRPGRAIREVELRTELVDLLGPMTLDLIPSSLFTSARSCIVTSARSECASVRWPCCENIRLKSSSAERRSYRRTLSR